MSLDVRSNTPLMIKKLFSHTLIYGLAPQVPRIASIFVLPLITPFLTELDFGIFGIITALMGAVSIFGTLGLNIVMGNMFVKNPGTYKIGWRQIYGFLMLWNIIYAVLLSLVIYFFIPIEAQENTWLIILSNTLPIILFGPTSLMGITYYRYHEKPLPIALRSTFFGFLIVGLNWLFIAHFKLGYLGWFYSAGLVQILLQLSYWWPVNKKFKITPIFNFKWRFIKNQLKVSLPAVPHYYSSYLIDSSDRIIMKEIGVPINHIGLYNAAGTLSQPFNMLGVAAGQAIGPLLLKAYKDQKELLARNMIFILQTGFLCATFIIALGMKEIFQWLIKNDDLQQAYPMAIILVMASNYRPMYFGTNNRLFFYENTKVLVRVSLIAGIANVLLNIILIPIMGYQIVAYTTFICLMYIGCIGYFLKPFKATHPGKYYPLLWLSLIILLTLLAYQVSQIALINKVMIMIGSLIISLGVIFILNKKTH